MTTRKTPRAFRMSGDGERSYREAIQEAMPALAIPETVRSAVAAYIHSARLRAELLATAAQHQEPVTRTDEDVLDRAAFDQLLDPEFDAAQRRQLFGRLLGAAMAYQRLDGVDPELIHDEHQLGQLWNATCGWGDAVQALLDDPTITEIKILGTTVLGEGPRGRVVRPDAYTSAREPLSRAEFLAQSCGVAWNRASPSVTLPLPSGMRMHLTRAPRVVADGHDEPGLLIVMRRSRSQPWTLRHLVEREMLSQPAAELLALLMHAGCAFILSGQQGAGKTTVLEALVNARSPDTHCVLVEDNANEFRLPAGALVTRLRIDDSRTSEAWRERQETVRENLRITPDVVVLSEVRGDEAGAVLQQAEAGRATLTTIHADTAQAALQRFARLAAAAVPNNSFAGASEQALRVLSEAFHVVVHVAYSQRLRRRYVQEVLLLDGPGTDGRPVVRPLVTTSVEADTVRWDCHAQARERSLIWANTTSVTPARVATRLADLPDALVQQLAHDLLAQPAALHVESGDAERDGALRRARAALHDGAWHDVGYYLTRAAQTRYDHAVIALIDQALAIPALAEQADQAITARIQAIQTALDSGNLDQARASIDQAPEDILIVRRRAGHPAWQQITARVSQIQDERSACQVALTQASTHRQSGDLSRALSVIRPFRTQYLPPELARTLLTARRSLLSQIIAQTQDDPAVQQHYVTELDQVNRDLAIDPPAVAIGTPVPPRAAAPRRQRPPAAAPDEALAEPVEQHESHGETTPPPLAAPYAGPVDEPRDQPVVVVPPRPIAPPAAADDPPVPPASPTPPPAPMGWLDAALAHNRERARLRQIEPASEEA
ncbi:MAG: ATPase, T2SS/T4P/T4SS family [Chloroflexales bacterium]